jgi:hypothetical protein
MKQFLDGIVDAFVWAFEAWRKLIIAAERTLVDNVAASVPWLAPISPAYMAFENVTRVFHWDVWVAWTIALAVEGLGLAVTSTAFHLWDWNDSKGEKDKGAPFVVAIVTVVFYISVVITVNVVLDSKATNTERFAKAMLSLLSIVAAVTLALRSQHARRLERKEAEDKAAAETKKADLELRRKQRQEDREFEREMKLKELETRRQEENSLKVSKKVSESNSGKEETFGRWQGWRQLPPEHKAYVAQLLKTDSKRMAMEKIVETYHVSERVAYGWLEYAERDFPAPLPSASPTLTSTSQLLTQLGGEEVKG